MKRYTISYFLVLVVAITATAQNQLKIATFNCEFLTKPKVHVKYGLPFNLKEDDKKIWEAVGYRDEKLKEAAKEVAAVINKLNADIITLTEVGSEADVEILRAEIKSLGTEYKYVAVGESNPHDQTRQYVAILSKFPLSNVVKKIPGREYYIPEPDDPESEEIAETDKAMCATVTAYNKSFIVYVLHLKSERGGHESDMQRVAQASIARRHMLPAIREGKLVIVTGDLNDYPGQPAIQRLRGFDDIDEDLIETGHSDYFEEDKLDTRWTYQYKGIYNQIDHILLSFSVLDLCDKKKNIRAETYNHGNKKASDHNPFIVTLIFK